MATEVRVSAQRVEWRDMMIDVWYAAGEPPVVVDADELVVAGHPANEKKKTMAKLAPTTTRVGTSRA